MTEYQERHRTAFIGLGLTVLMAGLGCSQTAEGPVRFATTRGSPDAMVRQGSLSILEIFETAPFRVVQNGVTEAVGRPTQFMVLQPKQIHAHLLSGRVQFAFIDEGDEDQVLADDAGVVIAKPVFQERAPSSTGLFVVAVDSPLADLAELKGKRVAFGPANHPVLHWAALAELEAAGVEEDDLAKQLLPIPGSLQHHINSLESAKAALFKVEADVGVVDEDDFMSWPETGGNILAGALSISIARDQLKVIGRTDPVLLFPSGSVVASRHADPELVAKVRQYLTDKVAKDGRITKPLHLVQYAAAK